MSKEGKEMQDKIIPHPKAKSAELRRLARSPEFRKATMKGMKQLKRALKDPATSPEDKLDIATFFGTLLELCCVCCIWSNVISMA